MNNRVVSISSGPKFPDLLNYFDAGQAAEQVSQLAIDVDCAVKCVEAVLHELSTVGPAHLQV